jgi:hypothetical protein
MQKEMKMANGHIFRIDRFTMPQAGQAEFMSRVMKTHDLLKTQPGFVQQLVLEKISEPGEFSIMTLAEWESTEVMEHVRAAVQAMQRESGFDPQEMYARLGIKADLAQYIAYER